MNTQIQRFPHRSAFLVLALIAWTSVMKAEDYSIIHHFGNLEWVTGFRPVAPLVQAVDGTLYGTTSEAEYNLGVGGTVFKIQPDGSGFTVLKYFDDYDEAWGPTGGLVLAGATLYGTAEGNGGAVFKLNSDGSGFEVLKRFREYAEGQSPYAGVVLAGTILYGTTTHGGLFDFGTVFKVGTDGSGFSVLHHFAEADGIYPYGSLVVAGATLYGTTSGGGSHGNGTVFRMSTSGSGFTVLRQFATSDGANPRAGLLLSGTTLYGTAPFGGVNDYGTIFKLNTDGTGFTVLRELIGEEGSYLPLGGLTLSGTTLYGTALVKHVMGGAVFKLETDGSGYEVIKPFGAPGEGLNPLAGLWLSGATLYGTTWAGGADDLGTIFRVNTDGGGFATVKSFAYSRQGVNPLGGLFVAGSKLYGTTENSADVDRGTVYRLNAGGGDFEVLHSFQGSAFAWSDGAAPQAGLAFSEGVFFGTTAQGGETEDGTVFRFDSRNGDYAVLKSFSVWTEGLRPVGPVAVSGGTLYGTTTDGGGGFGSVWKMDTNGSGFAVLKAFDGGADGGAPESGLVAAGDTLYGTAASGGSAGAGTVFKLGMDGGNFTLLKDYDGTDGAWPRAGLALSGEWLYGLTEAGGSFGYGTVFTLRTNGTDYTVLKEFDGFTEGGAPRQVLVVAGSTLYGCTGAGGANDWGTVFKLKTDGSGFAVLKDFDLLDGAYPTGPLLYADGVLYGTTSLGGQLNAGVVFRISLLPALRIERAAQGILLAWPHPSTGFELQQNVDLGKGQWSGPEAVPVQVGDEWQVTVSPASGNRFYRLFKY